MANDNDRNEKYSFRWTGKRTMAEDPEQEFWERAAIAAATRAPMDAVDVAAFADRLTELWQDRFGK